MSSDGCLLIHFLCLLVSGVAVQPFYHQCTSHCPLQNRTGDGHLEVGCGPECEISQCLMGCALWERALEASCKTVCNGTEELLPPKELFCVMGCNDALNRYLQTLKDAYGVPPAPALVADSLTSTSLRLEWESHGYKNLTWLAQWRYEPSGSWEYAREQEWGPGPTVRISGLAPYTNYRFRIVVLSQEAELVSSEASLVIGTLPEGPPTSPPASLRATPTGPSQVSVSWSPGIFINGPLLSYDLMIEELPSGYRAHKDIPASDMKHFYMFQSLTPSRNYSVTVAMRNAIGLGPPATAVVTTPNLSEVKEKEKTTLILGTRHSVLSQNADMLDEPVELYTTANQIRGVGHHVRKGIIFVSDSMGRVLAIKDNEVKVILESDLTPHSLSVDWLNDQLYVLGLVGSHWEVARCQLDGTGITVAVAGLATKPLHIHVDPYNGYLFWLVQGSPGGGLYRLDLTAISNGIKHETSPDLILNDPNLGAFTVDYTNFRILVSSHEKNSVLAVSLDGKETTNIRMNTASPQFKNVISLTMAHGLFYWTNGYEVLTEEYHPGKDNYFHNVGTQSDYGYISVGVDSVSAQPTPVPVNPPTCLQAVLGAGHATAAWAPPHLLGGQGKGAWQGWSYKLSIEWEGGGNKSLDNINMTQVTVNGLRSSEMVKLRVAAVTDAGLGPWSAAFTGRTLSSTSPSLLWSASQGVLKSDPTGENLTNLLHRQHFQDNRGRQHVTDIAWYKDVLYLVTNTSQVFIFNTSSMSHSKLRGLEVGSIAVDWIGERLYWSNPKQQLITRGHLNGSHQEPLPILTVAKELNIDALNAFIYWSTGHAVECARLNGKQRRTYYPAELFSGKQVMGLTLDMHKNSVYWIVRNYEGSTLFRAQMADDLLPAKEIVPVKMALTQYPDIQGPLCYFDSRLLWLRDDRNAVIGDLNGTNSALLNSMSLTGLNMVTVVDSSLHPLPELEEDVSVIPDMIEIESLHVIGNFSHFNITWDPIANVNLGQVFYELKISHDDKKEITVETTQASWQYPSEEVPAAYTELRMSIKALTYWGSSVRQSIILHSPESVPTQPLSPRAFVTFVPVDNTGFIKEREVILRWEMPSSPNGKLVGYKILSWMDGSSSYLWVTPLQHITSLQYRTKDVPRDSIVFFQVRACTKVGCSLPSAAVRVDTGRETPLPLLLMSTEEGASLLDVDRKQPQLLASHRGVVSIAYTGTSVFCLDSRGSIDLVTDRGETKVVSLNNTGVAIVTDWIGRFLYWSEKGEKHGTSSIKRLDLSLYDHGVAEVETIAERPNLALHLQVDPTKRMLYWIEEKPNKFAYLMKCSVDNCKEPSYFFGHNDKHKRNCNCPESPTPWPVFFLDTIQPKLFWIDAATGSLLVTDLDACHCHLILDNYIGRNTGLPPTSLTGDLQHIYWTNGTENHLYKISKSTFHHFENVSSLRVPGLKKVLSYGRHLQPLPDLDCLIPKAEDSQAPILAMKTSDSLTLNLGESMRPENCHEISRVTSTYIIYYGVIEPDGRCPCAEHLANCYNMTAYNSKPHLTGLLPYTSYIIRVIERNHYLDLVEMTPKISLPYVFRTAPGAPSSPEEISGFPLSPTVAEIKWEPPRLVNSWRLVRYEVVWRSRSLADGVRHNGEQVVETKGETNDTVSVRLQKLIPGQTYNISVRAYSENSETFSESSCINLTTYPEPPDLTLVKASPYTLNISWPADMNVTTHSHEMEYMDVASGEYWQPVLLGSYDDEDEVYFLDNLKPRTMYTFRMRIVYVDIEPKEEYIWPLDSRFTFRTLGDRPSRPGRPVMQHLSSGVYQVAWEPSKDNGAVIMAYYLEGKHSHPSKRGALNISQANEDTWNTYYNGTYNYWKMTNDMKGEKYNFRVRAQNSYGWSDYSDKSTFDLSQTGARLVDSHDVTVVLWVLTPTAIFITLLLFVCVLYRTQVNVKKVPVRADTELATLRELPRWSVQNTNALYSTTSPQSLPKLRRDQITLTKFLGSGAFGEVFEGLAITVIGSEGPTRVAVKTLRKGANVQEKAEFLKEAQLMSNFRHPHILQLLGVCLDNDPHFIIMELMEGGDLLSYLRSSRPLMRAWDLLSMCVDVARGCCYLEEMHFVHRDLACRNCLVSSRDPVNRVVKIGDFGLARDIYKNDYYRKEGEGLLPVRWMAPESLVDGVFTSQSDVWAFGVLLWEIMTLGQQPYPARNNLEVLHYVRGGGRLTQPIAASSEMYSLMMKCWSFNADERPTFKYCLDILVELKEKIPNVINPTMPEIVPVQEKREEGTPKYLELVYEDEGGYEVPRSLEPTPEDDKSSLEKLLPGYTNMSSGEAPPTR